MKSIETLTHENPGENGATTAEYAVTCGVAVGFAGVLFRFLSSEPGQKIIGDVFEKVMSILPF